MQTVPVRIKKSEGFEDLEFPKYETDGACAMDLLAAVNTECSLSPGDRRLVMTGISIALPAGYEAQIRPRSGLALKQGISIVNSPGTIDSDYRGKIGVILINHGHERVMIKRAMRIAQMVVQPVSRVSWEEGELDKTDRGEGGFGHTGS
ncbi:MAG: dUTP diphosphatase [Candidatus Scalindua sp.]|nr:dUTP diphosphatase [Candidatus Scalindua sp.]